MDLGPVVPLTLAGGGPGIAPTLTGEKVYVAPWPSGNRTGTANTPSFRVGSHTGVLNSFNLGHSGFSAQ